MPITFWAKRFFLELHFESGPGRWLGWAWGWGVGWLLGWHGLGWAGCWPGWLWASWAGLGGWAILKRKLVSSKNEAGIGLFENG